MIRGGYLDARGVLWDPNEADMEGWLSKKSAWLGEWRARFFVLKGGKLFYCKSEIAAPHGMINLVDCISIRAVDERVAKKSFAFEVTLHDERFLLCSNSTQQQESWVTAIKKSILRHASIYLQDEDEACV